MMGTVHPHFRPEQLPVRPSADEWQAATEQSWEEEDDHSRPSHVWLGIALLIGLIVWFVVGCLAVLVFG